MRPRDLERFFQELARRWRHPTTILLIGGAGSLVLGGVRPTLDVDFEVRFHRGRASWEEFEAAVRGVTARTGLGAQYAESIERWSQITLLDYRRHTRRVTRVGGLDVRVLEPAYWSIGKMGRYWDQDVQDMLAVFRRQKPNPLALARLWQRAIRRSPKSTQLALARRQALHFFETFGRKIWGPSFSIAPIQRVFSQGPAKMGGHPPQFAKR